MIFFFYGGGVVVPQFKVKEKLQPECSLGRLKGSNYASGLKQANQAPRSSLLIMASKSRILPFARGADHTTGLSEGL